MKYYHGTSKERWKLILQDGFLWGYRDHSPKEKQHRYTYLSLEKEVAEKYGEVLLEVEYTPTRIQGVDNYGFNHPSEMICWQFSVFVPISLEQVKRV